ncbi:MAG: RagB/SusD family nutrient uptake outer membrane protein, partial [Bacteroidetes bacterium]|nr:RagB/SusD family nutrient uptake outer membrane protein [Bacteroidota bacterium]
MKKIQIIILVTALAAAGGGCRKKIELSPITSNVESSFYQTEGDCFQALTAAYSILLWDAPQSNANVYAPGTPNASYQNAPFQLISEVLGDRCFAGGASATDVPGIIRIDRGVTRTDDPTPAALWYKYYTGINRCNLLLEKMPPVPFADSSVKGRYTAECKFLRAYYYFDLVRLFGNVPLILHTLAPSEYSQKQSKPEDVYAQIAKDLQAAIAVLPRYKSVASAELGRATSDAARGLLMRAWLYYTGYYQKTEIPGVSATQIIAIADDLINNSGHDLLPNFSDVFQSLTPTASFINNHKESVFEIQYSSLAYGGSYSYRELANGNLATMLWSARVTSTAVYAAGWSFAPVDSALYNQFDNTDKRKAVTFFLPKTTSVA